VAVANLIGPGNGFHVDPATLDASSVASYASAAHELRAVDMILHVIPKTFVSAFAEGDLLQVLLVALLFGFALGRAGDQARPVLELVHAGARVFFAMVELVTRFAPLAAGGAMAFTVGKYGIASLGRLGLLMACVYLTCIVFVAGVLGGIARLAGFRLT